MDFIEYRNGQERTSWSIETDIDGYRNGLQLIPKRTSTGYQIEKLHTCRVGKGSVGPVQTYLAAYLVNDCHLDVSPVNKSDSERLLLHRA